jgi:nitroreductase
LSIPLPPQPEFGEALPTVASPETLAFLARRRSASAMLLSGPGPGEAEVRDLITLAARVPDHGKLSPWRFIVIEGQGKVALAEKLMALAARRPDAPKANAALGKFRSPPMAICVVSHIVEGDIPAWEQELSAGAVCVTLLNAALAMGYGANWITDWYSVDEEAKALYGVGPTERVAGFVYIGKSCEPPLERVRPDIDKLITRL